MTTVTLLHCVVRHSPLRPRHPRSCRAQRATGACFACVALEATGDGPARIFLNVTDPSQTVSLERHISPTFGTVRMRTVTPDQVTRWYLSLNSNAPTERAHAYPLLNAIFATAADPRARIVSTNPCQISGAGQVTRAHEVRTATLDELVAIVGALPPRLRLAVLLGAWCALRYGEVAELRRADIDLGKGLIRVRRGVS